MKAYVKAWQDLINPATGKVYDEEGLRNLNSILYGPEREIEEVTDEIAEDMKADFEKMYPDFRYDQLEIHTDY